MRKLLNHLLSPAGLLYMLVVFGQFGHALFVATGARVPGPTFTFIYAVGFLWILTAWLLTDSRKRGITLVYEIGLFLYIAWPVFMPYYVIKTRRAKGLLVIGGFLAAYIGAWLLGFAVSLFFQVALQPKG